MPSHFTSNRQPALSKGDDDAASIGKGFISQYPDAVDGLPIIVEHELEPIVVFVNGALASVGEVVGANCPFHGSPPSTGSIGGGRWVGKYCSWHAWAAVLTLHQASGTPPLHS